MSRRSIVLVVDDTPGTLGLLNETLEEAGYTVLMAQSAATALAVINRVVPDIILIDAVMPEMDGFEACRRFKRNPSLSAVPIVFMTGLTDSEDVVRGLEAGGVDYVTKPLQLPEMVARMNVHLANARRTRSAHAALDTAGRFLLAADADGTVLWSTPQASLLLNALGFSERCDWIPNWLSDPIEHLPGTLAGSMDSAQFFYVGRLDANELLLRIVERRASSQEMRLRNVLGLTTREAEVLLWVGHGKTTRDIADILGLSPRTIHKHLEQIYAKLGVETRASAAAIAIRTLG